MNDTDQNLVSKDTFDFGVHLLKMIDKNNFWYSIDEVMKWKYRTAPEEMKHYEKLAAKSREGSFHATGAAVDEMGKKQNDMRSLGIMPSIFSGIVAKFYPQENSLKFYREFFKRYPKLRIAKKI